MKAITKFILASFVLLLSLFTLSAVSTNNVFADNYLCYILCPGGDPQTPPTCCQTNPPGGCFLPGTAVRSSTGTIKIEDVKVGDSIASFDDKSGRVLQSKVTDLHQVQRDYYYSLIAGGYNVKVTAEHPFYTGNGQYKEAQYIKPGDVVYVDEDNSLVYKVVAENIKINQTTTAYNLTVDNSHTFFANDFAVHNKGGGGAFYCPNNWDDRYLVSISYSANVISVATGGSGNQLQAWNLIWGTDINAVAGLACNGNPNAGCQVLGSQDLLFLTPADPHSVYYIMLIGHETDKRSGDITYCGASFIVATAAQCETTPNPATINVGSSQTFTTNINSNPNTYVTYYNNPTYTTINPVTDASSPYQTVLKAIATGSSYISSVVYGAGYIACMSNASVTINPGASATVVLTPATASVPVGATQTMTATVSNVKGGSVGSVTFTSSNPAVATVLPASDTTSPYTGVVKGVKAGSTTITAHVVMGGSVVASDTSVITVPSATCTLVLTPATANVVKGGTAGLTATVSGVSGGVVSNVTFTSSKATVATVAPASDASSPYTGTVTAVAAGSATITASGLIGGVATCTDTTAITVPAASATIVLTPPTANVPIGGTAGLTATVSNVQGGVVSSVTFTSSAPTIATVLPASDTTSPYNATVTAIKAGSATITARVIIGGVTVTSDTSVITVPAASATIVLAPATANVPIGTTTGLTATVSNVQGGVVSSVTFTSNKPAVATVAPASDTTSPYDATVTGVTVGSATITAGVIIGGVTVASATSVITVPASSCVVSLLPAVNNVAVGSSVALTASVTPVGGTVDQVNFVSTNPAIITVAPASDATVSYTTNATGVSLGSTTARANVIMGGVLKCTNTSTINTVPASPWWRVKDSDLSSNGDLKSVMVPGAIFDLNGPGGFPGIPAYAGSTNLTLASVSSKGWLANSPSIGQKTYDYAYFANQIPASTTINNIAASSITGNTLAAGGTIDPKTGYFWYKYDGSGSGLDLTLTSAANLGARKVVLLVNSANFNINVAGNAINLTKGQGFFMVLVGKDSGGNKGNIFVNPTVGGGAGPNLEGLYLADGTFNDGVANILLSIRGSIVANNFQKAPNGVNMQRDLGGAGNLNPSEVFEYAPDQTLLFPSVFGVRRINWKEVAP